MTSYARQAAVLRITQELALEGFMHFLRVHEGKAKDYPKFVEDRLEAAETLEGLALIEEVYGPQSARDWFLGGVAKAKAKIRGQGAA